MASLKKIINQNTPRSFILAIDLLIALFSFGFANLVAEAITLQDIIFTDTVVAIVFVASLRLVGFLATQSYTDIIRYTSTQDAVRIFFAVAISTFLLLVFEGSYFYFTSQHLIKPVVIIIDAFMLVFFYPHLV